MTVRTTQAARSLTLSLALAATLVGACAAPAPEDTVIAAETVALFPDDPGRTRIGALRYVGGVSLASDHPEFGGWSALELSPDASRILALSDRGAWMTARLELEDGAPQGLSEARIAPLLGPGGDRLSGEAADAEGLAPLGDGAYAVSFERRHRIAVYALGADWSGIDGAAETAFPAPPGADRLRANAGIEALAADGERLFAAVEDPIVSGQPHTLWIYDRSDPAAPPRALQLAVEPGFGLTALTIGPQGALYLVERFWAREVGNRIRIARVSADQLADTAGAPVQPERLAEIGPDMTVDNIEAAAFAELDGAPLLVLMSDDNFNDSQRTLLLAFRIEG